MRSTTPYSRRVLSLLLVAASVLSVVACSEDSPTNPPEVDTPPPVPEVIGYNRATVSCGDTLVVDGTGFLDSASDNVVGFANALAQEPAFSATSTSLRVVVPANAATGPVTVTIAGQPTAGVGPDLEVEHGLGEVWRYRQPAADGVLRLPQPDSLSEYLLIPHATSATAAPTEEHTYTISSEEASAYLAPPADRAGAAIPGSGFERHVRDEYDRLTSKAPGGRGLGPVPISVRAAVDSVRTFNVVNTADTDADLTRAENFAEVTARLRYDGQHCLIYSDVDTLTTGNLTTEDFQQLGARFDDPARGIRAINNQYFGMASDVDQNGKVIVLISGVVNRLPWTDPDWHIPDPSERYRIDGFFLWIDLFDTGKFGLEPGTTNRAEIVYLTAADPDGYYLGEEFKFPTVEVAQRNMTTLAHEYEHLISYSRRIFDYGFDFEQDTWLEEGMAHIAEDLNGMNENNLERANKYLLDPGAVSLEYDAAPLNQRGGIYLLLRYLGDRFGDSVYKQLLQSKCVGRSCIESITGENFYDTLGDFLAALYLSGKAIAVDDRFQFPSFDQGAYDAVHVVGRAAGDQAVTGTIKRASGDFYLFTNKNTLGNRFQFTESGRAGLKTMVVRTR